MTIKLNRLKGIGREVERGWPGYMFGGRIRTSTVALIVVFIAAWWLYDTYRPTPPPPQPAPQIVPPGFVPDPNYTWVPRTRVQPSPTYYTPTPRPTTTVPTTTPPTTTTTTTTTSPPLFQLPVLPPPFGPGTSTTPTPAPPGSSPAPVPIPGLAPPGG